MAADARAAPAETMAKVRSRAGDLSEQGRCGSSLPIALPHLSIDATACAETLS